MQIYKYTNEQVCKYASIWLSSNNNKEIKGLQVFKIQVCMYVTMQVGKFANLQEYKCGTYKFPCINYAICEYATMRICKYVSAMVRM